MFCDCLCKSLLKGRSVSLDEERRHRREMYDIRIRWRSWLGEDEDHGKEKGKKFEIT